MSDFQTLIALGLTFAFAGCADQIPRPSPEFTIATGTDPIRISQYKGKVTVVIFLLTYCPHCQKTVGVLSKLQTEYAPKGLQVVGCAVEDMANMYVPDFVKKFQPAFPMGWSLRDPVLNYLEHPPMLRLLMPNVVVIDRQFAIQAQYAGDHPIFEGNQEANLRAVIEPLLKKTARHTK